MLQLTKTMDFENECCSIELVAEASCLVMTWKGLLPSPAFREVHQQALSLIRKHSLTKILGDARRMKTIGSADGEWITNYWLPSANAAGFRYYAIIESDYIFNQNSLNSIIDRTDPEKVVFRKFKEFEPAIQWLKNC
jgi:hypothetical protein